MIKLQTSSPPGTRRPVRTVKGRFAREGAGVRNIVTIGMGDVPDLDPFLLFAEFGGDDPADYIGGFPSHPHRGFETVTYVIEGRVKHADSRGNEGRLGSGAVQRMKAARGILHAEMPDQTEGPLRAFQLWLNLPARHKMDEPAYQDVPAEGIPVFERDGVRVKVLVGSAFGLESPIAGGATDLMYLDVALASGTQLEVPVPHEHAAFAYVYQGRAQFSGVEAPDETVVLFSGGDRVAVSATRPARLVLLCAAPIREPVVKRGPFVMTTMQEIQQAFADYQAGHFGA